METPLSLQPCRISPELFREPLPFDIYSIHGTLLWKQGSSLKNTKGDILSQSLFRQRLDSERKEVNAPGRLENLLQLYGQLTERWSCTVQDVSDLKQLAGELVVLCETHSDVCVGMAPYIAGRSHALRHSFCVAIVSILLGTALGLDAGRLNTLARAAMTMNLSLLSNHDDWKKNRGPLNEQQKMNVRRHSSLSADLLSQTPGVDLRWIAAVDQHHENLDGSGYPLGLKGNAIAAEARVLRAADIWCALVMDSTGRGKKTPMGALGELSNSASAHLDHLVLQALKNLMGYYPPGTLIRLDNRETAVVTHWTRSGSLLPLSALGVLTPSGEVMREFRFRNTRESGFRIRDYTLLNLAQTSRIPWLRVWSSV